MSIHRTLLQLAVAGAIGSAVVPTAFAGVVYQDLPLLPPGNGFSPIHSVHRVGGPVVADDWISAGTGHVVRAEWWGSRAASSTWELTLHFDAGGVPAANPPATGGFKCFVNSAGVDPENDGIFLFDSGTQCKDEWQNFGVVTGGHYWFSAANLAEQWLWSTADGVPEVGGQTFGAQVSFGSAPCGDGGPHCGAWGPVFTTPVDDLAFRIHVPEPGTLALLGIALGGLGWSRRRMAG